MKCSELRQKSLGRCRLSCSSTPTTSAHFHFVPAYYRDGRVAVSELSPSLRSLSLSLSLSSSLLLSLCSFPVRTARDPSCLDAVLDTPVVCMRCLCVEQGPSVQVRKVCSFSVFPIICLSLLVRCVLLTARCGLHILLRDSHILLCDACNTLHGVVVVVL